MTKLLLAHGAEINATTNDGHTPLDVALQVKDTAVVQNLLGVAGWWLNARVLRRRSVPGLQARLNDRLVPLLRLERRLKPPIGMSLLAVGRVPA